MQGLGIIGIMAGCALVAFFLLVRLVRGGHSGLALSILSIIGAGLVVLLYAAGRPTGVDPVRAMSAALLFALPALAGGLAGGALGWLLRQRDDRKGR